MAFSASKPITLKQEQCHQTHWRNPLNQSVHIQRYTPVNQHSNWKIHLILDGCSPFLVRKDSGEFFSLLCQFTGFESTHLKPTKIQNKKGSCVFWIGICSRNWWFWTDFLEISGWTPFCAGSGRHGRWNETTRLLQVHQGDEEKTWRFLSVRSRFFFERYFAGGFLPVFGFWG